MPSIDKRELGRQAQDILAVYNPDDVDYPLKRGGHWFVVPAPNRDIGKGLGIQLLPQYLARRYMKHKTDEIIGRVQLHALQDEDAKRRKKGQPAITRYLEREIANAQAEVRAEMRAERAARGEG